MLGAGLVEDAGRVDCADFVVDGGDVGLGEGFKVAVAWSDSAA